MAPQVARIPISLNKVFENIGKSSLKGGGLNVCKGSSGHPTDDHPMDDKGSRGHCKDNHWKLLMIFEYSSPEMIIKVYFNFFRFF